MGQDAVGLCCTNTDDWFSCGHGKKKSKYWNQTVCLPWKCWWGFPEWSMCANVASANKPTVSLEHNSWFHVDGCYFVNKSSHKLGEKLLRECVVWVARWTKSLTERSVSSCILALPNSLLQHLFLRLPFWRATAAMSGFEALDSRWPTTTSSTHPPRQCLLACNGAAFAVRRHSQR